VPFSSTEADVGSTSRVGYSAKERVLPPDDPMMDTTFHPEMVSVKILEDRIARAV